MKATTQCEREEFNKVFLKCARNTLENVLGKSCAGAILHHIKASTTGVKAFAEALEEVFGPGAYVLEKNILTNLYSRAGRTFQEKGGYKFINYVGEIKALAEGTRSSNTSLWEDG